MAYHIFNYTFTFLRTLVNRHFLGEMILHYNYLIRSYFATCRGRGAHIFCTGVCQMNKQTNIGIEVLCSALLSHAVL